VNFGGSSYLGLSGRPEIVEAGVAALRLNGAREPFSSPYGISTSAQQAVQREAAAFLGSDDAAYLATGYQVGMVATAALSHRFTSVFADQLVHSSLRDAVAGLEQHVFRHLDAEDLARQLERHLRPHDRPLVVTDGVYSVLGEMPPLDEYAGLAGRYGGCLLIDESHSWGVLGASGRGAAEYYQLDPDLILIGGSLSKAFGVSGGVIPGSTALISACRDAPAARGASPGSASAAAMAAASFAFVRSNPQLRRQLRANVAYLKRGLRDIGLAVSDTAIPIASFVVGSADRMRTLQEELMSDGIHVLHSRYIGAGAEGVIRCGIFADHTTEHLDRLIESLRRRL
jgi:7-keto-8-aminopelargonate synthetase-like enzyme